jgi:hypothetical protein
MLIVGTVPPRVFVVGSLFCFCPPLNNVTMSIVGSSADAGADAVQGTLLIYAICEGR